ncbi:bifunctional alcohol dehydrogenase/S-(hydroxymethyl)glutathione dehydrogenase [Sugiyamaella lignohabitans]|uniref:Bifunctional alcohol dehydrogenase/S-(Hydroxymethyl)glutathione dehydrogenase n=1 Tax=Sugiyamaella lignohabitans TaxID=796027 RepID=A0A167EJW3_9ASCO|nr:bifunctional alcohol dehydrogenase/S-(hydroxymethyl)glutathione dehydrogenase [Sugiyamaella lignohabitans]ANB14163.1 bifunctional alcohol dehydrogenase/S-(hydroxymethyl)glutathione dehydrogenase [Sugiyamaella lignohabitans]
MASMKALVYNGPHSKKWTDVPKPKILKPTDAIVKVTATTICGTDLHILKGDVPEVSKGRILGHEGIGIIDSVGESVASFKKGDRVLMSCITSCGSCVYCSRNLQSHCLDGGWILGHLIDGTQAEYVRIPFADNSLYSIPKKLKDESVLCLSDALPTGYEVGVLAANVQPGDTVAIIGAGPVGLSVLMTTQFFSPAIIIMIDTDDMRLEASKELGATHTINPTKLKSSSTTNTSSALLDAISAIKAEVDGPDVPANQQAKPGVDVAIECVGIPQTFDTCQQIIAPGGRIANVGVHGSKVDLQLQDLWIKNIQISTGLVSANTTRALLKSVQSNKIKPDLLVTHKFNLSDIERAYEVFGRAAEEKAIKVLLQVDD